MLYKYIPKPFKKIYKIFYWKIFYQKFFPAIMNHPDLIYMNYGYAGKDFDTEFLKSPDYKIYPELQKNLYKFLLSHCELQGKELIEIGCGRGGGCSLIHSMNECKRIVGVDLTEYNIRQCKKEYVQTGIEFFQGDAEKLNFPENSFNIVLNLESSHCYGSRLAFFKNVYRILRNHGDFLYADIFWGEKDILKTEQDLLESGLKIISTKNITADVIRSMELQSNYKEGLILNSRLGNTRKKRNIMAVINSDTYRSFKDGKIIYNFYHISKN